MCYFKSFYTKEVVQTNTFHKLKAQNFVWTCCSEKWEDLFVKLLIIFFLLTFVDSEDEGTRKKKKKRKQQDSESDSESDKKKRRRDSYHSGNI